MSKRLLLLRAVAAFLALPGVVAFLVPLLIAAPTIRAGVPFRLIALAPLLSGVGLLLWCVRLFLTQGKGTLAPWNPPRQLVVTGPYAISRNPMYVAVVLILAAWAIGFHSLSLLAYAAVVLVAFHLRVRLGEEPWLVDTFHDKWTRYAARVPRWLFRTRRALAVSALLVPRAAGIRRPRLRGLCGRGGNPGVSTARDAGRRWRPALASDLHWQRIADSAVRAERVW
jgi:protein-S-isoprenylcysteine O-methyltransferase Ste14